MLTPDMVQAMAVLQSACDERLWGEVTFTLKNGEIKLARSTKTIPFDGKTTNGKQSENIHG